MWAKKTLRIDDLRSAAYVALIRAANNFDASKGFQFWTYAEPAVRNASSAAARPRLTEPLGGAYSLTPFDEPIPSADGEGLVLSDTLPGSEPDILGPSFGHTLRPMLTARQYQVLYLRYRRFAVTTIGQLLGITRQRVDEILQAALARVEKIVATDDAARRSLVATQFYAAEVIAGNAYVQPHYPRAGFTEWLAKSRFEAERWARGSDPAAPRADKKLSALRTLPSTDAGYTKSRRTSWRWRDASTDALFQIEARTWQDAGNDHRRTSGR